MAKNKSDEFKPTWVKVTCTSDDYRTLDWYIYAKTAFSVRCFIDGKKPLFTNPVFTHTAVSKLPNEVRLQKIANCLREVEDAQWYLELLTGKPVKYHSKRVRRVLDDVKSIVRLVTARKTISVHDAAQIVTVVQSFLVKDFKALTIPVIAEGD